MPYIKENKSKQIKESYTPDWIEKIQIKPPVIEEIPWINIPQIVQSISIET